jgi:SLT domain-containing protein
VETQPTDQLGTWINEALQVLQKNGYSADQMDAGQIRTIIEHESGGDPNAINNWDTNAAQGTPSKGLMQTIDPTFKAWALPGHGDIYDPVDNIIAAVRYSIGTYGSISEVPGIAGLTSGSGYQGY